MEIAGTICIAIRSRRMSIEDFKGKTPIFLPEKFFVGTLEGWAVMESPLGGLQKRAIIKANGRLVPDANTVAFSETYTFDDGHVDTINWTINKLGEGRYEGHEPTVDGHATGEQAGFAFHWSYTRNTPQNDDSITTLNFDDWFYLIEDDVCIVRGTLGRLGLPFAVAHVTYRKIS